MLCKLLGHKWVLSERSNVIQFDDMGYPLRLFNCQCSRCKKHERMWIDSTECNKDVELKWTKENAIPIPQIAKGRKTNET